MTGDDRDGGDRRARYCPARADSFGGQFDWTATDQLFVNLNSGWYRSDDYSDGGEPGKQTRRVFANSNLTYLDVPESLRRASGFADNQSNTFNVTFGNAPELIIALFALGAGLHEVVKASLVGSILGNILLVLGVSMLAGGARREEVEEVLVVERHVDERGRDAERAEVGAVDDAVVDVAHRLLTAVHAMFATDGLLEPEQRSELAGDPGCGRVRCLAEVGRDEPRPVGRQREPPETGQGHVGAQVAERGGADRRSGQHRA